MLDRVLPPLPVSSSEHPQFPPQQQELFRSALRLLKERRASFAVSGAFALHQHTGIWRDTKDLDVFLAAQQVPALLSEFRRRGFECEICDPVWLAKVRHSGYYIDLITGMSNGVIRVDESWAERGRPADVLGMEAPVLAAEELIVSKLFVSRRERFDGADIAHVVYCAGARLDWERLLHLVDEHWGILLWALVLFAYVYPADTQAVPQRIWDLLLGRFHHAVRHPDAHAPFRGSLVDEFMFAIDVREWGLADQIKKYRSRRELDICEPLEDAV